MTIYWTQAKVKRANMVTVVDDVRYTVFRHEGVYKISIQPFETMPFYPKTSYGTQQEAMDAVTELLMEM